MKWNCWWYCLVCTIRFQWCCSSFRQSISSMVSFEIINKKNTSCMIYNSTSTVNIRPEVIYIWSFEVSRKGVADHWLEVTIDLIACRLCLMYLHVLKVILSKQSKKNVVYDFHQYLYHPDPTKSNIYMVLWSLQKRIGGWLVRSEDWFDSLAPLFGIFDCSERNFYIKN